MTKDGKLERIALIDAMFESATGWGSWMVEASNERFGLVERLKKYDATIIPHKYVTNAS